MYCNYAIVVLIEHLHTNWINAFGSTKTKLRNMFHTYSQPISKVSRPELYYNTYSLAGTSW